MLPPSDAAVPPARPDLLGTVQRLAPVTVGRLARRLRCTHEAARQALAGLAKSRLVRRTPGTAPPGGGRGRPPDTWVLTPQGLEALPKAYATLTLALVDAVAEHLGPRALRTALGAVTDARVRAFRPRLARLPLAARVRALRAIYREDDAFLDVERTPRGWRLVERTPRGWRLVERNCPFLRVATARPAVCSTTVATLSRLLGCRVVREERFQAGDGCCAFRVDPSVRVDPAGRGFEPEPEPDPGASR